MTRIRATLVAALLAIAAPATLAAQGLSTEQRLSQALDASTYAAVNDVIAGARAKSLPVDPIVDKALEGAVKRAPGTKIRAAVSALADRLVIARDALSPPTPSSADIAAGAGALGVGIPRTTLRTIREAGGDRPVAVPLGVLTELVARGVSVRRASEQVVALVKSGATPQQLAGLGEEVQHDIDAGIDAGAALDVRARGLLPLLPGSGAATGTVPTLKPKPPPQR